MMTASSMRTTFTVRSTGAVRLCDENRRTFGLPIRPGSVGGRLLLAIPIVWILTGTAVLADEPVSALPNLPDLSAREAVREGNRLLGDENPTAALEAYDHAEELRPEAREIAFAKGLAHYERKEFDQAREAFRKAAAWTNDSLADDARYSLGTCDHAEGLDNLNDPQLAMSLLESAMQRYHDVLAGQPEHTATRDANLKAASMWRELKRRLQEQQQQQDQDPNRDSEQNEQDSDEKNQQQQQDENEQEQEDQPAQPQEPNEQQEEQEQQADSAEQQEEQQEQQQASEAEQQEQASREQAERMLREMMQAQRERKKMRREPVRKIPVVPVDKDW